MMIVSRQQAIDRLINSLKFDYSEYFYTTNSKLRGIKDCRQPDIFIKPPKNKKTLPIALIVESGETHACGKERALLDIRKAKYILADCRSYIIWTEMITSNDEARAILRMILDQGIGPHIPYGELVDRIVIDEIKLTKLGYKQEVVQDYLCYLNQMISSNTEFPELWDEDKEAIWDLTQELSKSHEEQWDWEDKVRFGDPHAAGEARRCNSRRTELKNKINQLTKSVNEIKQYKDYIK